MITFDKTFINDEMEKVSFSITKNTIILITSDKKNDSRKFLKQLLNHSQSKNIICNEKNILYINNKINLYQNITIMENIKNIANIHNTNSIINATCKYFAIDKDMLKIKTKLLPKNIQKKIILMKIFLCPANIWILDNPFCGLGENWSTLLINAIQCKKNGVIFIGNCDKKEIKHDIAINVSTNKVIFKKG